jgi:dinuclear metal center YbgI/SA1388 family protein
MRRDDVLNYLETLLQPAKFRDYCPNGLQVEGCPEIRHVVAGVTASQALIDAAIARGADTILVHHGYFWKGEDGRVTGIRRERLKALLAHDINLIAYHLPLDAHAELGNNAQWAMRMGWQAEGRFGDQDIAWLGLDPVPGGRRLGEVAKLLAGALERVPQVIGDLARPIRRIAWCSGGAQSYFEQAIACGVDAYCSGEISEQTVHLARESGVAYLACGHHATERFGAQALSGHLAQHLGLQATFVDIDNPV